MFARFGETRLELAQGDITRQVVDAIVNAANRALAGGGGVDGAIHAVAGPDLMRETRERYPQGCSTGDAVLTSSGQLPARFVIHAVGPVWRGGAQGEAALLSRVHRRCLELAVEQGCQSIAFPALSTGAYGYPKDLAAETSLRSVAEYLIQEHRPSLVRFVLFDAGTYGAFSRVLDELVEGDGPLAKQA